MTRTRAWRGAEIPAAGGTGNARAMAVIHAVLANGGAAAGRRFMSDMAYAMNRMTGTTTGDPRAFGTAMAAWEAQGPL